MLEVRCPEHVTTAQAFADTLTYKPADHYDHERKTPRQILDDLLNRYADDPNKLVVLMSDTSFNAKYNFYYHVYTRVGPTDKSDTQGLGGRGENYIKDGTEWNFWYNGGYIFNDARNRWDSHT